ncbi:hypothetical protein NP493_143g04016 [Ridgeia piscesae]|uniref:Uncharacterized protein n=1 Tax=Ridgeia piscesae TaxID=27915 RepID=A0AAD9P522_RIDPI|nr:hypothetical protein NP493_143g04016 [Ridgeia piscesae]
MTNLAEAMFSYPFRRNGHHCLPNSYKHVKCHYFLPRSIRQDNLVAYPRNETESLSLVHQRLLLIMSPGGCLRNDLNLSFTCNARRIQVCMKPIMFSRYFMLKRIILL